MSRCVKIDGMMCNLYVPCTDFVVVIQLNCLACNHMMYITPLVCTMLLQWQVLWQWWYLILMRFVHTEKLNHVDGQKTILTSFGWACVVPWAPLVASKWARPLSTAEAVVTTVVTSCFSGLHCTPELDVVEAITPGSSGCLKGCSS